MKPRQIQTPSQYFGSEREPVQAVEERARAIREDQEAAARSRRVRLGRRTAAAVAVSLAAVSPVGQHALPAVADAARAAYNFVDQGQNFEDPGKKITAYLKQGDQQMKIQTYVDNHQGTYLGENPQVLSQDTSTTSTSEVAGR